MDGPRTTVSQSGLYGWENCPAGNGRVGKGNTAQRKEVKRLLTVQRIVELLTCHQLELSPPSH